MEKRLLRQRGRLGRVLEKEPVNDGARADNISKKGQLGTMVV